MLRRVGWVEPTLRLRGPGDDRGGHRRAPGEAVGDGEALGRVVPEPVPGWTTGHPSGACPEVHDADLASRSVTIRCASASVAASSVPDELRLVVVRQ